MNCFWQSLQNLTVAATLGAFLMVTLATSNACAKNDSMHEPDRKLPVARFLLESAGPEKKAHPTLRLEKDGKVKSVSNCKNFIKSIRTWNVQEGVNNMRVAANYQSCVAHSIFELARSSRKSEFRNNFPDLIFHELKLDSFPSSLHNQTEKNKWSIAGLGMKMGEHSESSVIFSPDDWRYRFDLLAKGDFDGDGNEDLLVRFLDQATKGNYYAVEILVLSNNKLDHKWIAREGVSFLRDSGM